MAAPVAGWTRFKVGAGLDRSQHAHGFRRTSGALGANASSLSPDEQALYREFLEWKADRQKPAAGRSRAR